MEGSEGSTSKTMLYYFAIVLLLACSKAQETQTGQASQSGQAPVQQPVQLPNQQPIQPNPSQNVNPGQQPIQVPMQQAPLQQVPMQQVPMQQVHPGQVPMQQVHPGQVPMQQVHPGQVPMQQVHPGQVPLQQIHPGQIPMQQVHPGQVPLQQVHPGQMPPQQPHPGQVPPQIKVPSAPAPMPIPIPSSPVFNEDDPSRSPAEAMEYKVHVDPGKEECYFQYTPKGSTIYVSFQVVRGGDGMAGFAVRNPKGVLVHPYQWKAGSEYQNVEPSGGYYGICVDNQFSRFAAKLVNLYITTFR